MSNSFVSDTSDAFLNDANNKSESRRHVAMNIPASQLRKRKVAFVEDKGPWELVATLFCAR